jgi:hypothetical protein
MPCVFRTAATLCLVTTTACIQARVITNDGRQYNLDGTERVPPKQRAHDAEVAMDACSDDVSKLQQAFRHDTLPAVVSVSASPPRAAKSRFDDPATRLAASLQGALDAVQRCSDANLTAIKVVWEEQRYLNDYQVRPLLEAHWRATQHLARAKEIAVTSVALSLAVSDAAKGKTAALAAASHVVEDKGDLLFADVPFDHDLRREVLLQALHDTDDSCGQRDESGKTTCDKILGALKVAKTVTDTVRDVQGGRILSALNHAMSLTGGDDAEHAREVARREAVLPLIPEKPALDRLNVVIQHATAQEGKEARAAGRTVVASDGVIQLLNALDR